MHSRAELDGNFKSGPGFCVSRMPLGSDCSNSRALRTGTRNSRCRAGSLNRPVRQVENESLARPDVQAAINPQNRQEPDQVKIDRQAIIKLAYSIATFDARRLFTKIEDGKPIRLLKPHEWPDDVKRVMVAVVTSRGIEYRPRITAIDGLEFCMKYAMFEDGKDPSARAPHEEELSKRVDERIAARRAAS